MWQNKLAATNVMLGWLLIISSFYYLLPVLSTKQISFRKEVWKTRPLLFVVAVALFVRLVPVILLPVGAGYDIESFQLVGRALLNGEDVYTSAAFGRHPYLPMQMYWIGLAFYLQLKTAVPFVVLVKLLPVFIDAGITAVVFQTCRRWQKTNSEAVVWALLFALNPIAILVSAYHGQFDSLPVLLLLLAWYWTEFGQRSWRSATALGFAILNKSWPVVMLPITLIRNLNWKYWIIYSSIALSIPVLFTVAYVLILNTDPAPMLRRALTHTGPNGYWGISALLAVVKKQLPAFEPIYDTMVAWRRWFILVAGMFALWWTRKETLLAALTTIILAVFTVSSGIGIQWLLWVVPLAILDAEHGWLKWYSLTGMIFLLVQLYGLHMYPWLYELFPKETADTIFRLGSIPAWFTVALWTASRIMRGKSAESNSSLTLQN